MLIETYWLVYKKGNKRQVKPFRDYQDAEKWALKKGYEILGIAKKYEYNEATIDKYIDLIKEDLDAKNLSNIDKANSMLDKIREVNAKDH